MSHQFNRLILDLPEDFTLYPSRDHAPNVFPVTPPKDEILCPVCRAVTHRHDKQLRQARHSYAWHIGAIWIEIEIPRQYCSACQLSFTHDYGLGLKRSATRQFRRAITRRCHGRSLASVAREYQLPYSTVERWFYWHAAEDLPDESAKRICVDEFALRKNHTYATTVINAETGHVLAASPGRKQEAVEDALAHVKGHVTAAVSDLAPSMANAIDAVYPNARHVLDRFHVIQFFTEALKRRRRFLGETKKHHTVRFIQRCLSRAPDKLSEEERGLVADWRQADDATQTIYQGLQHMRYVLKARTQPQANRRLSDWFSRFIGHSNGVMQKIAKQFILRKDAMIAAIVSPLSNGIIEGTNNKIKLIKRRAYGYRNDAHFFLRLRLETGHQ